MSRQSLNETLCLTEGIDMDTGQSNSSDPLTDSCLELMESCSIYAPDMCSAQRVIKTCPQGGSIMGFGNKKINSRHDRGKTNSNPGQALHAHCTQTIYTLCAQSHWTQSNPVT